MAEIKYSAPQIEELKQNKYVKDCTRNTLHSQMNFKILVLKWI